MNTADDENVRQSVRIRAVEEDSSVAAAAKAPESHAETARRRHAALQRLLCLSETAETARGGTHWTRDELHDR